MLDNLPNIPAEACDPGHAKLIITALLLLCFYLGKELYDSRKGWKKRIEDKLDIALTDHAKCRETLPERFLSKEDFRAEMAIMTKERREEMAALTKERTEAWAAFNKRFEEFSGRFWTHNHDVNGKVDRQP